MAPVDHLSCGHAHEAMQALSVHVVVTASMQCMPSHGLQLVTRAHRHLTSARTLGRACRACIGPHLPESKFEEVQQTPLGTVELLKGQWPPELAQLILSCTA